MGLTKFSPATAGRNLWIDPWKYPKHHVRQCTEVRFASLLSGGFTYYYGSNKFTGNETGKTPLCALVRSTNDSSNCLMFQVLFFLIIYCKILCKNHFSYSICLVDESFIPSTQRASALYWRLWDFKKESWGPSTKGSFSKVYVRMLFLAYCHFHISFSKITNTKTKIFFILVSIQKLYAERHKWNIRWYLTF